MVLTNATVSKNIIYFYEKEKEIRKDLLILNYLMPVKDERCCFHNLYKAQMILLNTDEFVSMEIYM